jgi:hypothetical protein
MDTVSTKVWLCLLRDSGATRPRDAPTKDTEEVFAVEGTTTTK